MVDVRAVGSHKGLDGYRLWAHGLVQVKGLGV